MTLKTTEKNPEKKARATTLVGMNEMKLSRASGDVIETGPLGSCVGLSLYDSEAKVGGVVVCMLPDSSVDPANAGLNPCLFVDTGVPALVAELCAMGAQPNHFVAKVSGAGTPLGNEKTFCLGPRNVAALREALRASGVPVVAEDVGGSALRSLRLHLADGETWVKRDEEEARI